MQILHISAECYPAAKAGGLGDVAGALPKYLNQLDLSSAVIIPKYDTKWLLKQDYEVLFRSVLRIGGELLTYTVEEVRSADLGFPLFVVSIPGKFDRPGVYLDQNGNGYGDEVERAISFQIAVLRWIQHLPTKPKVLHCHDHHTGLVPFLVKYGEEFNDLAGIPTVFTIHNGQYTGAFSWKKLYLIPYAKMGTLPTLDWGNAINPLATAIKTCWRLTTVSPSYMNELRESSNGMESLLRQESHKSSGILNGIDVSVWDPTTDPMLAYNLDGDLDTYKQANKQELVRKYNLDPDLPIITFIGRLVREKGADLLPDSYRSYLQRGGRASFIILGTGEPGLHQAFSDLERQFPSFIGLTLAYNEALAHQLYAGSDYLIMPSRVEPCGLNQMYAYRYGTIPIVRSIGGLIDTVRDVGSGNGQGIRFDQFSVEDTVTAIQRSVGMYYDRHSFEVVRGRGLEMDFSWERSAHNYANIYHQLMD